MRSSAARRIAGAPTTRPVSSGTKAATLSRSPSASLRRAVPLTLYFVRSSRPISTVSTEWANGSSAPASTSRTPTPISPTSAPSCTISRSGAARCERPVAATSSASTTVVFPAPFAPQRICGPLPKAASSDVQLRIFCRRRRSIIGLLSAAGACSRAPRFDGVARRWSGRRSHRHDHVEVVAAIERSQRPGRNRAGELQRELVGLDA